MEKKIEKMKKEIEGGKAYLGIELGSTRIKSVLINEDFEVLAQGSFQWEASYIDGFWTYSLDEIKTGLANSFKDLKENVSSRYGLKLEKIAGLGISGMMHGLLAFDKNMDLITPFRTWRNTNTDQAVNFLTDYLGFNIPHRWSVAHLYQAILNKESFVDKIDYMTTLSGYVHYLLSGQKVLGIGDASGMFPVDKNYDYRQDLIEKFDQIREVKEHNIKIKKILPKVMVAGENAGNLTPEGAKLLDPDGNLESGAIMCPPEGDAGTGMVATNSVSEKTGNISIGTSIFSMIVLEKDLEKYYKEIDIVTTPDGKPVAMVHCNNGTADFDAWLSLFAEFAKDNKASKNDLYSYIYNKSKEADLDAGGLIVYNYLSGEPINGVLEGRPMVIRKEDSKFTLANFILVNLYSIMATIRIGQDILTEKENVIIEEMLGHGGVFKSKEIMQNIVSAALDTKVATYASASEGGPWGIAILAAFSKNKKPKESLDNYLEEKVFAKTNKKISLEANADMKKGFEKFLQNYKKSLPTQKEAGKNF